MVPFMLTVWYHIEKGVVPLKEVQLKVRLSEELREKVQVKAKEENKSVNQALVDLLERYVNGQEEVEIPKQVEVIDKPYSKHIDFSNAKQIDPPEEYNPLTYFKHID
jgi:hypothetical protein